MYKYLLAADGSDNSLRAAMYLIDLARRQRELDITVLCVQDVAAWFTRPVEEIMARTESLFKNAGVQGRFLIKEGDPGDVIVETAASLGVDHVVMGARGMGHVKGMILGSVSQRVIQQCKCPVTIIK